MFDTGCLFTPFLPPPSSSSTWRSPNLKPDPEPETIPEADLLNLNGDDGAKPDDPPAKPKLGPRRKTGFSKHPGGSRRKVNGSGSGDHVDMDSEDEDFEEEIWVPDVFLFEYGTVVIWGMTEKEEKSFLRSLYVGPG